MKIKHLLSIVLFTMLFINNAIAQLDFKGISYYENQHLNNPAMTGLGEYLELNLAYSKQMMSMPGSPVLQSVSSSYGFNKIGLGINVFADQNGLVGSNKIMGTYAYHLPVGDNQQKLSFGISAGIYHQKLDLDKIEGELDDEVLKNIYRNETAFNGDFGIAYHDEKITLQAAFPNINSHFHKETYNKIINDYSLFFSAISYKYNIENLAIEPLVAYKTLKHGDHIFDVSSQLTLKSEENAFTLTGIWHNSKNTSFGTGFSYKDSFLFSILYTTETKALRNKTNGGFELALKLKLNKKIFTNQY